MMVMVWPVFTAVGRLFYSKTKEMAMAIVSRPSTNTIREPMLPLWLRAAPWLEHVPFDVYLYGVG